MWSEFHFLRPYWFIAFIPLLLLLWRLARQHLLNKHWESVCDPELLPTILVGKTGTKRYKNISLLTFMVILSIFALAGPTWERLPQPVFQKKSSLVIALDLSYSMYADDVKPSRLERARFEISDLLNLRKEGQTALLVYAGDAFTVTPLTDDIKTIKSQLSVLSPEIMPVPGSNTHIVINKAIELLKQAGTGQGHILLVSDEVDPRYEKYFKQADNEGYPVSILAIGTDEGAPVRLVDGGFLKDHAGTIVIPRLDQNSLRHLVNTGNGHYELSLIDDPNIERLNQIFNRGLETNEETGSEFETDQWYEFGPWLVLLVIPIVVFGFRRGYLGILLGIMIIQSDDVIAFEWDDLWLNKNQRAMRAFNNGKPESAAELFQNEAWKAAAKYRAGDYAAAAELFNKQNDVNSIYNRANALAQQGRYKDAIAAYDEVLSNMPEHEGASSNKQLVKDELEKQQDPQQSQSDQNSQQQDSQESDSQNQQQNKEQQETEQSRQDREQPTEQQSDPEGLQPWSQGKEDDNIVQKLADEKDEIDEQAEDQKMQEQELGENHEASKEDDNIVQKLADEQDEIDEQAEDQKMQEQELGENHEASNEPDDQSELDEQQQALEQWLRSIPDDPAELLKRKFKYQYQQQKRPPTDEQYW